MALWKRGRTYWTDFTLDGKRYRLPLGTRDEREAKRLEKLKIAEATHVSFRQGCVTRIDSSC